MVEMTIISMIVAFVLMTISYSKYMYDVFNGTTRPHAFSWFIWSILSAIAFAAQIRGGGGIGSWIIGIMSVFSFTVFVFSLVWGEREITISDKVSLVLALISLALFAITKNAVLSVIIIIMVELFSFFPTYRKSWFKPQEETSATYLIGGIQYLLSVLALDTISFVTAFYPVVLIVINWAFVVMQQVRIKQLSSH